MSNREIGPVFFREDRLFVFVDVCRPSAFAFVMASITSSETVMACLVTGWLVGLIAYQHGVKEALRSVDRALPPADAWEYPHPMNTETVALVCAGLGVIATVAYTVIGVSGIKLLRDMRDRMGRP